MLPDFPKEKSLFKKRLNTFLRTRIEQRHRIASLVRSARQHEGGRFALLGQDSTSTSTEFVEISSTITINRSSIQDMSDEEVEALLLGHADDLAKQEAEHFYRMLGEAAAQDGSEVQVSDAPLTPDLLLRKLAKIDIGFDAEGKPLMPTVIVHPTAADALSTGVPQWESDPIFKRRWDDIIAQKREEFRVREAGRKLVD